MRAPLWQTCIVLGLIILIIKPAKGQTFHKNDLPYLVAAFKQSSYLDDTRWRRKRWKINNGAFENWRIVKTDSTGSRDYSFIKPDTSLHWVYDWDTLATQDGNRFQYMSNLNDAGSGHYHYYFFMAYFGFELKRNILTVWEQTGGDSLRFVHASEGMFTTSMGSTLNKFTTTLTDGSTLIAALKQGGDAGDWWGSYNFYKANNQIDFKLVYEKSWSFNITKGGFYDVDYSFSSYDPDKETLVETITFYHYNKESYDERIGDYINPVIINDSIIVDTLHLSELE